jgi:hypothetical protein
MNAILARDVVFYGELSSKFNFHTVGSLPNRVSTSEWRWHLCGRANKLFWDHMENALSDMTSISLG